MLLDDDDAEVIYGAGGIVTARLAKGCWIKVCPLNEAVWIPSTGCSMRFLTKGERLRLRSRSVIFASTVPLGEGWAGSGTSELSSLPEGG